MAALVSVVLKDRDGNVVTSPSAARIEGNRRAALALVQETKSWMATRYGNAGAAEAFAASIALLAGLSFLPLLLGSIGGFVISGLIAGAIIYLAPVWLVLCTVPRLRRTVGQRCVMMFAWASFVSLSLYAVLSIFTVAFAYFALLVADFFTAGSVVYLFWMASAPMTVMYLFNVVYKKATGKKKGILSVAGTFRKAGGDPEKLRTLKRIGYAGAGRRGGSGARREKQKIQRGGTESSVGRHRSSPRSQRPSTDTTFRSFAAGRRKRTSEVTRRDEGNTRIQRILRAGKRIQESSPFRGPQSSRSRGGFYLGEQSDGCEKAGQEKARIPGLHRGIEDL